MKFYHIAEDYIDFLRGYDSKVPMNKNGARPYIGVLLVVEELRYFAPLTSPKPKHLRMKNGKDFRKIGGGKYGAINLNNMIPVPENALIEMNIDLEPDLQYRNLLRNQQRAIRIEERALFEAAKALRELILTERCRLSPYDQSVQDRCCDLGLLETVYFQYRK